MSGQMQVLTWQSDIEGAQRAPSFGKAVRHGNGMHTPASVSPISPETIHNIRQKYLAAINCHKSRYNSDQLACLHVDLQSPWRQAAVKRSSGSEGGCLNRKASQIGSRRAQAKLSPPRCVCCLLFLTAVAGISHRNLMLLALMEFDLLCYFNCRILFPLRFTN
ncbi:hypothetical protein H0G86_007956 [Trichoderma simmonsii]|uniref:Uncharacterized protein n=1 Tax=Trichoderma simmonsii TaxID=1491479 RepID=A0A8G0PHL9_9HYPO|nr:hypothetical protein H0G86_007956 [Trichoderma simmonsii]